MNYLGTIFGKIAFIILIIGVGVFIKKVRWISDSGERDVGRLMIDVSWPALVFASINTTLTPSDITGNIILPILTVLFHLVGFLIGLAFCSISGYTGKRKHVFLFHATLNNFLIMSLPFVQLLLPGKGLALLSVSNLGSTLVLWTIGVTLMAGKVGVKAILKLVFSPVMIAMLLSVFLVLTKLNTLIPHLIFEVSEEIGKSTLFLGLVIAGTQISKLGKRALKFDRWNIQVGLVRNIAAPAVLFVFCLLFKQYLPHEAMIILLLISIAPASVNSITLALRYDSAPELAAEGVLFTHLLALPTMIGFMFLFDGFLF